VEQRLRFALDAHETVGVVLEDEEFVLDDKLDEFFAGGT